MATFGISLDTSSVRFALDRIAYALWSVRSRAKADLRAVDPFEKRKLLILQRRLERRRDEARRAGRLRAQGQAELQAIEASAPGAQNGAEGCHAA